MSFKFLVGTVCNRGEVPTRPEKPYKRQTQTIHLEKGWNFFVSWKGGNRDPICVHIPSTSSMFSDVNIFLLRHYLVIDVVPVLSCPFSGESSSPPYWKFLMFDKMMTHPFHSEVCDTSFVKAQFRFIPQINSDMVQDSGYLGSALISVQKLSWLWSLYDKLQGKYSLYLKVWDGCNVVDFTTGRFR